MRYLKSNKEVKLLSILSEEASEIMLDILNEKQIQQESFELLAVADMLKLKRNGVPDLKITNNKEYIISLLQLQYHISKAIRFGYFSDYKGEKNIYKIQMELIRINDYIITDELKEKFKKIKSLKIKKVNSTLKRFLKR